MTDGGGKRMKVKKLWLDEDLDRLDEYSASVDVEIGKVSSNTDFIAAVTAAVEELESYGYDGITISLAATARHGIPKARLCIFGEREETDAELTTRLAQKKKRDAHTAEREIEHARALLKKHGLEE